MLIDVIFSNRKKKDGDKGMNILEESTYFKPYFEKLKRTKMESSERKIEKIEGLKDENLPEIIAYIQEKEKSLETVDDKQEDNIEGSNNLENINTLIVEKQKSIGEEENIQGSEESQNENVETSEEEQLDMIFDNPGKFSPEEIIDTIINLSGYNMLKGYRRFKDKFKSEEQIQQIEDEIVQFVYDNKSRMESNEIKEILLDLSEYGMEQGYEKLKDYNKLEPHDRAEINNRIEEYKGTLKEEIKNKNSIFQRVWNGIIQLVERNK